MSYRVPVLFSKDFEDTTFSAVVWFSIMTLKPRNDLHEVVFIDLDKWSLP